MFLHTALLVPFYRDLWSPGSFAFRRPFEPQSVYDWVFFISGHPALKSYYGCFVAAQLVVLALAMAGVAPRLMNVLVCLATMNVNNLTPVILDGGNNLSQLILMYMLVLNTTGAPLRSRNVPVQMAGVALSNAAFLLCRLQVVVVYVCTAFFKLNGPLWQNGMALYYIFQSDAYSHPALYRLVMRYPAMSLIGTYFTVGVQVLLPTLVWFRRTRPFILLGGILTHLGISFGMGLFTFGLIMCVMYALFLPNELSAAIIALFSPFRKIEVCVRPQAPRLETLLSVWKRLDWFCAVRVELSGEGNHKDDGELRDSGALSLVITDDHGHVIADGPWALVYLTGKVTLLVPLLPFVAALYYLGVLQSLFKNLERHSARVTVPGVSAAVE